MGGMQTHSLNMTLELARHGVDLDVYHPGPAQMSSTKDKLTQRLPSNVSLQRFEPPRHRRFPGHYIAEAMELSSEYLKHYLQGPAADVIYAKGLMATAFLKARLKQSLSLPPIITNVHGYESFQSAATIKECLNGCLLRPSFRFVIDHSDYVVSYGGRITDLLRNRLGVSPDRIIEIPGAVDNQFLEAPLPAEVHRRRTFAFVGRYERRKGLEELAQALHRGVPAEHDFHVVGPIPDSVARGFPSTVTFHGKVSDRTRLIELFDSIDVLVCPSWSEGMPNVIMEAMARKTAVIATDVGATCLLVDYDNGRLIQPRKRIALTNAIRELTTVSGEELSAMKFESRRRIADRFTWATIGPQSVRLLCAVLEHECSRSQTTAA